jgi:hypothetical protein
MTRKPEPIEWDETTTTAPAVSEEAPVEEEAATLTAQTIATQVPRRLSVLQTSSTRASLVIPGETTTVPAWVRF